MHSSRCATWLPLPGPHLANVQITYFKTREDLVRSLSEDTGAATVPPTCVSGLYPPDGMPRFRSGGRLFNLQDIATWETRRYFIQFVGPA